MDAHTLNAWTRFALQKGGIGSATALVDNPATDIEDLMFMAGEKIIVLRRLDEDSESPSAESSAGTGTTPADGGIWYLGYCEGVVGRFKGAHVQIEGKLKKPVLMRRSGVGAIRESTLRPMSKSEAAALHASQVPPGIPVAAIDSDGDDLSTDGGYSAAADSSKSTSASCRESILRDTAKSERSGAVDASHSASQYSGLKANAEHYAKSATAASAAPASSANKTTTTSTSSSQPPQAVMNALGGKMNRLGVTTPPLSDETHARAARQREVSRDSDSDDSDTQLPWARASTSSVLSKSSGRQSRDTTDETLGQQQRVNGTSPAAAVDQPKRPLLQLRSNMALSAGSHLPPSPISSSESPLQSRPLDNATRPSPADTMNANNVSGVVPRIRAPAQSRGHKPQGSTDTITTESSDDQQQREHNTFSIYDIYGRDSVAFPNFNFRSMNGSKTNSLGARLAPGRSGDSSSNSSSRSTPSSPNLQLRPNDPPAAAAPQAGATSSSSTQNQMPPALRVPSQRRPMAAPPVTQGGALPNRRQSAEQGHRDGIGSTDRNIGLGFQGQPGVGSYSGQGRHDPHHGQASTNPNLPRQATNPMGPPPAMRSPVSNLGESAFSRGEQQRSSDRPIGSNLMARRMRERTLGSEGGASVDSLRISVPDPSRQQAAGVPSPGRPFAQMQHAMPSPTGSSYLPARSSSDRMSERDRGNSVNLRKNPSNPQPGAHGGLTGLAIPNSGQANGGFTSPSSRSPSPLSAGSARSPRSEGHSGMTVGSMMPFGGPQSGQPMAARPSQQMSARPPLSQKQSSPQSPRLPQAGSVPTPAGRPVDVSQLSFDAMGFVKGSCPPMPSSLDDPEDAERWQQIVQENDTAGAKKSRRVKKMVHNGIPQVSRSSVWPFLQQSYLRRRVGLFEDLCKTSQSAKGKKGKEDVYSTIEKDVERAYPEHKLFIGEARTGQADLEAILKAYVHYNPIVGYTQGMNLLAGFLLIQMPAEDAFWMFCALLRDVHIEGYYSGEMKQLHVDGIVFGQLLHSMDPDLATRLLELNVEPIHFTPGWILPMFARVLPWPTLLRVWDVLFFEGPSWILRVALAIIRIIRDPLMDRRMCPGHGEALRLLLHPPQQLLTPDNVLPCAFSVKLKEGETRKLSRQASKVVRQTNLGRGTAAASAGAAETTAAGPSGRSMSLSGPSGSGR